MQRFGIGWLVRGCAVGVPSQQELEKRFTSVHDNCQKVALLPPEGGGVLQYALANVVQVLSLSERGMVRAKLFFLPHA